MFEAAATALVAALAIWVAIGLPFALWFVIAGLGRVDRAAHGGSVGFKILILPASIAFWPWLAWRCAKATRDGQPECNAHRRAASARTP